MIREGVMETATQMNGSSVAEGQSPRQRRTARTEQERLTHRVGKGDL